MRNPKRLDKFYDEFKAIHQESFANWRFGQTIGNFFGWLMTEKGVDYFFPEEDKMLEYFREYAKENKRWN